MNSPTPPSGMNVDDDDRLVGVPSHPLAATVGAIALGGATGAVMGTVVGPVGTVIGAVAGAVVGALGGDAIASSVGEAAECPAWRDSYASRSYVAAGSSYDDYRPAFALGEDARRRYVHQNFDDIQDGLAGEWHGARGDSTLAWDQAKHAVRMHGDGSRKRRNRPGGENGAPPGRQAMPGFQYRPRGDLDPWLKALTSRVTALLRARAKPPR